MRCFEKKIKLFEFSRFLNFSPFSLNFIPKNPTMAQIAVFSKKGSKKLKQNIATFFRC